MDEAELGRTVAAQVRRHARVLVATGVVACVALGLLGLGRLSAGHGLVACTTGSLQERRSGPVVVDARTGAIIAYAPIDDPAATYSDNGRLTAMGFLDADTVLLLVGVRDQRRGALGAEAWHLVAWRFREGAFERIASGGRALADVAVAPSLVGRTDERPRG